MVMYLLMKAKHRYALEQHDALMEELKATRQELKRVRDDKERALNDVLRACFGYVIHFGSPCSTHNLCLVVPR